MSSSSTYRIWQRLDGLPAGSRLFSAATMVRVPYFMSVQYLAKATTSLRAQARLDPPDFGTITEGVELVVPVSVCDDAGREVCTPTSPPG